MPIIPDQTDEAAKERAFVVLLNWRKADKSAIANKQDRTAGRAEYKQRNNLRDAADQLKGQP